MPQGDRTGPQGQGRKLVGARENAALKAGAPHHRDKVVWEPAGVKAVDQAEVPAGVRAKAKAPDRAAAGSINLLTNQFTPLNISKKTSEANLTGAIQPINDN